MMRLLTSALVVALLCPVSLAWGQGVLGNPSFGGGEPYSGISVVSGWKCEANGPLTVRFFQYAEGDSIELEPVTDHLPLLYGNPRPDTRKVCGDVNNGFVLHWNWGHLSLDTTLEPFTAIVYDNGVEFDQHAFYVTSLAEEFVEMSDDSPPSYPLCDFPREGAAAIVVWNPRTQHLEIERTVSHSSYCPQEPPGRDYSVELASCERKLERCQNQRRDDAELQRYKELWESCREETP